MQEDRKLKTYLVLQSFCPLFILLFIKYCSCAQLAYYVQLLHRDLSVIKGAINKQSFGEVVVVIVCLVWFLITAIVALGLQDLQRGNFDSHGEKVIMKEEKKDSGVTYFVTFVLPLLIDDVSSLRGLVLFVVVIFMVIYLIVKSDLFYQSPVLVALNYKVFKFQFANAFEDVEEDRVYLGLTKGALPAADDIIKRRYIADNVFLIYKD